MYNFQIWLMVSHDIAPHWHRDKHFQQVDDCHLTMVKAAFLALRSLTITELRSIFYTIEFNQLVIVAIMFLVENRLFAVLGLSTLASTVEYSAKKCCCGESTGCGRYHRLVHALAVNLKCNAI